MSSALQHVALAFVATLFFITLFARLAPRLGLMDSPDYRKHHSGDVPLVGGIAIFATLLLCSVVFSQQSGDLFEGSRTLVVFLSAASVLVALGIVDDRRDVSVFTRVAVEVVVAIIIIEGLDLRLAHLGDLLGTGHIALPAWLTYPFTVVCIFGIINAFNMLDGMDGLLSINVLITIFAFHLFTGIEPGLISLTLTAALAAFLISNLKLAPFVPKSFLGDAGSKLLGFIVVALILTVTSAQIAGLKYIQPVTALYLVGLPLFDMVFTTCRRLAAKSSPFRSDRSHIHHLMQAFGLGNSRSLLIISCISIAPPFVGLMLHQSGAAAPFQFYIFIGFFFLYCVIMSQAWRVAESYKQMKRRITAIEGGLTKDAPNPLTTRTGAD